MAPDEVRPPAQPEVDLADGHGPAFRAEHPVRQVLGVGPDFEDEPARRGASKMRVMPVSRSDGVVNVVALPLFVVVMIPLLFF